MVLDYSSSSSFLFRYRARAALAPLSVRLFFHRSLMSRFALSRVVPLVEQRRGEERAARRSRRSDTAGFNSSIGCPNLSRLRASIGKSGTGMEGRKKEERDDEGSEGGWVTAGCRDGGEYPIDRDEKERKIAVDASKQASERSGAYGCFVSKCGRPRKKMSFHSRFPSVLPSSLGGQKAKEREKENRLSRALVCRELPRGH